MADFSKVSQQYVRALTTAHQVARKHSGKVGGLVDRVIQDKNRIQIHAKKAIVVDPKVLARLSVRAKESQEKLQEILKAKVVVPRTIKPVFVELTKHIDDLISVAGVNEVAFNKLQKGLGKSKFPRIKAPKLSSGGAANDGFGSRRPIAAIDVNDPGEGNPKGGRGKGRG